LTIIDRGVLSTVISCTGWITNRLPRQAAWEALGLAQQIQVLIREDNLRGWLPWCRINASVH